MKVTERITALAPAAIRASVILAFGVTQGPVCCRGFRDGVGIGTAIHSGHSFVFASGTCPSRRAQNRGNVTEDPLGERIADGGNPGYQGQRSTHSRRSASVGTVGKHLFFDRVAAGTIATQDAP